VAETAYGGQATAAKESLGDLVALAVSDISQLVRYEVDLAKLELKSDARRLGIGAALFGVAAFVGCLVLMVLSFAFAYGLNALGIWLWAAFLIVAGTYGLLLIPLAVLIGFTRFKGLTGLRRTRSTVSEDLALIKRDESNSLSASAGAG
jgi:GNAT superfamily N-acetyltransferase